MIYTVTFNPSYDYIISVKDFKPNMTNRADYEAMLPGGKGINVSIVLKNLGVASTALGFIAGFTGEALKAELTQKGICCDFVPVKNGFSRINIKFKEYEGTEINGRGPDISEKELGLLMKRLSNLKEQDILVLAGSVPASVPEDIYRRILKEQQGAGAPVVVDAAGKLLSDVLEYRPFLVKPNKHELGELFGAEIGSRKQAAEYGRRLQELGARNVLVSMAGEGAVFIGEDGRTYDSPVPEGRLVNGVGAGDSMVAGFLAGWLETRDYEQAFYMGLAAGSASAFSEGLARKDEIVRIYRYMEEKRHEGL